MNLIAAIACLFITAIITLELGVAIRQRPGYIQIIILLLFVAFGLLLIKGAFFSLLFPMVHGMMEGAAVIFFAFSGFGRVAMISEEAETRHELCRVRLSGRLVSGVIYALVAIVAIGMVGPASLGASNSALAEAAILEGN